MHTHGMTQRNRKYECHRCRRDIEGAGRAPPAGVAGQHARLANLFVGLKHAKASILPALA